MGVVSAAGQQSPFSSSSKAHLLKPKPISPPTMGLKLRMGLALSGLALSSMFGVNMLSGIKDYVDTTGNIMVDIADGIGMVSKGIEALEYYIDPSAEAQVEEAAKKPEEPATDGSAPVLPGQPPGQPVAPVSPDQPAVFCQKGKCYPYDPSKVKGVNLEAKPGMIIQAAPTTTSPKKANPTAPPQRGPSPPQKATRVRYHLGRRVEAETMMVTSEENHLLLQK